MVKNLTTRIRRDDALDAFEALQAPFYRQHIEDEEAFKRVAKGKIDVLANIYGTAATTASNTEVPPLVDALSLDLEFESFYMRMISAAKNGQSTRDLWKNIFVSPAVSKHMRSYCVLAKVMMCLPVTSVENERQFSLMNLLKNEMRNSLGQEHMNCLSRIKRSTYNVETFPYSSWLKEWLKPGRYCVHD